jgi:hypothetical protein
LFDEPIARESPAVSGAFPGFSRTGDDGPQIARDEALHSPFPESSMLRIIDRRFVTILVAALVAACGHSNPTAPSTSTPAATTALQAAATVSSVLPAALPPSQATQTLVVEGANFMPGLSVIFAVGPASGSTPASDSSQTLSGSAIQNLTSSSFEVNVTVPGPGQYTLRVINPSSTPSEPKTVTGDPTITGNPAVAGLSPRSPVVSSAPDPVYVVGTGFISGVSVVLTLPDGTTSTVGGSSITFGSPTVFQMRPTFAQAGAYSLRVVNPSGQTSDPFPFTVQSPEAPAPPVITSLSPGTLTAGTPVQLIYVSGTGFQPGLAATLTLPDGSTSPIDPSLVTFGSSTIFNVKAVLPTAGAYALRVTNPSGATSTPFAFTVTNPEAPASPTIAGLSPRSPIVNAAVQLVYVGGAGFQNGLTVTMTAPDGSTSTVPPSAVTFGTSTAFSMRVVLATVGSYALQVTNPSGQASPVFPFTVKSPETPVPPAISSISPGSLVAGTPVQGVYVNGSQFQSGLTAVLTLPDGTTQSVDGTAITFGSSTVFKMNVALPLAGSYTVQATNPSGLASNVFSFSVAAPAAPAAPTTTGISPESPVQQSVPQGVYVAGTGFQTGLTVALTAPDGTTTTVSGSAITFGSSMIFKMTVTLLSPGTYSVVVTNPSGLSSAPRTFTVKAGA